MRQGWHINGIFHFKISKDPHGAQLIILILKKKPDTIYCVPPLSTQN
jgi:hypothetical protein